MTSRDINSSSPLVRVTNHPGASPTEKREKCKFWTLKRNRARDSWRNSLLCYLSTLTGECSQNCGSMDQPALQQHTGVSDWEAGIWKWSKLKLKLVLNNLQTLDCCLPLKPSMVSWLLMVATARGDWYLGGVMMNPLYCPGGSMSLSSPFRPQGGVNLQICKKRARLDVFLARNCYCYLAVTPTSQSREPGIYSRPGQKEGVYELWSYYCCNCHTIVVTLSLRTERHIGMSNEWTARLTPESVAHELYLFCTSQR